jgi:hypothetical protein
VILYFEIKTSWRNNFFLFLLQFQTAMSKWSRGERGKGCIRGVAFHSPLRSFNIRGAMLTGNKWAISLHSVPQSFVHFPVATERSGTLLTLMGNTTWTLQFLKPFIISPLRSVPQSLVQALEQFPVPTERSGTLLDGNTTWTLQLL